MYRSRKAVLGIDPGMDGGVAMLFLGPNGEPEELVVTVMPTKPGAKGREIDGKLLGYFIGEADEKYEVAVVAAAVEAVHSMPKQGVASSFTFGKGYGKLLGVLENEEITLYEPTPQQWKKIILDGLGKEKHDAIRWALNHWPKVSFLDETKTEKAKKHHDGKAEAACLAEYARLEYLGIAQQIKLRASKGKQKTVKPTANRVDTPKPVQAKRPRVYPETSFDGYVWVLEYIAPNGRKNALKLENDYREALAEAAAFLKRPQSDFDYFEKPVDDDNHIEDPTLPVQAATTLTNDDRQAEITAKELQQQEAVSKKGKVKKASPPKPAPPPPAPKPKKPAAKKTEDPVAANIELQGFPPPPVFDDSFDF